MMKVWLKYLLIGLIVGAIGFLALQIQFLAASPVKAQSGTAENSETAEQIDRPFQLPFAEPSSLETWLMAQPYGNTTGAYRQRFTTYGASGGIHFGVDLSAPCGTEVVAIADGIVFVVDGPFGSPPHNLMIDHPDLGYASMYGHLLEPPDLRPGQRVRQGQVVALTGDSRETCYGRPHLHLEIRDLKHFRKYNPMMLIEANWDNLIMTGNNSRNFARDLTDPRKWQSLYDQPQAQTGGPIINDFADVWPLDWEEQTKASVISTSSARSSLLQSSPPVMDDLSASLIGQQITPGNCCTQPYWNRDSTQVRFIDQPTPAYALGVWGIDVEQSELAPQFVTEKLAAYSPDGRLAAYPNRVKGVAVIERLADGRRWEVDTDQESISFTPDSRHIMWTTSDDSDTPRDLREQTLWLANTDGSNARAVFKARRTSPITWLSDDELLMSRSFPRTTDRQLFVLSIVDGSQTVLIDLPRVQGLSFSPDNRYLVYYVAFEPESEKNGTWLLDLQNPKKLPQPLPFFGTYRWQDSERLIYIPFDPEADEHNFFEYNVTTEQSLPLFPNGTGLIVANNDWRISPDGGKIALVAANGAELNGIWVLDIGQN